MKWLLLPIFFLSILHQKALSRPVKPPQVSRPEKFWALQHPFKTARAYRITSHVRAEVDSLIASGTLDTLRHGGKTDAFRHAYWMALLSNTIGEKSARKLGKAHEKGNYLAFKKNKTEDGFIQDETATEMDLHNNEVGISVALKNPNVDNGRMKTLVLEEIRNGQMKIFKVNKDGAFCDCEGRTVAIPVRSRQQWKLPYCLINSNE